MNKKMFLIIILGLYYSGIFAQPAYYKLFNDSILSATIVDRGIHNYLYCHVLEDEFLETYTPYSISEYTFRGSNTFVARDVLFNLKKERVFLELLVDGKVDLYYFENETFFTFFYEDNEGNLVHLPKKGTDKSQLLYTRILKKLASDCTSTDLSTEKLRYTKNSLKKFINAYNDCENYSNSSPDTSVNPGNVSYLETSNYHISGTSTPNKYKKAMIKTYFCGSIRGGRDLADTYAQIIKILLAYGDVLTEHVADQEVLSNEKASFSDREIYMRDTSWLEESDIVVAEVSAPSLGVGFEIAHAMHSTKPILCLYNRNAKHNLSAMISGCPNLVLVDYELVTELELPIKKFFENFYRQDP